jgi:hypothetical protein
VHKPDCARSWPESASAEREMNSVLSFDDFGSSVERDGGRHPLRQVG